MAEIIEGARGCEAEEWQHSEAPCPPAAQFQQSFGGSETILLVEDEAFVRNVTCELIRSAGYVVFTGRTAFDARRAFESCGGKVELLISDIVLPDQNGYALASEFRQFNPEIQILFMSGYAKELARKEAVNDRTAYLAKPFSASVLLSLMRKMLDECAPCEETTASVRRVFDTA